MDYRSIILLDEKTNEQNHLADQYQVNDMSISSDSYFEETLQNHFQYTPKSKSDGKIQKNDSNSIVFTSSVTFHKNFKSSAGSSREGNFSLNITRNVDVNNGKNPNNGKRRLNNDHFDPSSPVVQFCKY
ncbi:hypothetical protein DINM_001345 [Dirofilaria immitis]|nr:hypothetical protein [Dirofilaria immitis]